MRLRGHHFLCLLTFKGLGYTPFFVENMREVAARIDAGAPVTLHPGPDVICNALSAEDRKVCNHDCAKPETLALDEMAAEATSAILKQPLDSPFVLDAGMVESLRAAFLAGETRAACARCRWLEICNGIAGEGFAGTLLKGFQPSG